jgi:NAD+ kinase
MQLAIYGKYFKEEKFTEIQNFFDALLLSKTPFIIYRKYYDDCLRYGLHLPIGLPTFNGYEDFDASAIDFFVSIGGDGTILNSLEIIREAPIPVVGINTGRLGFLAGVAAAEAGSIIEDLNRGHYSLDKRTLLELSSDKAMFGGVKYALNDFVLHKKDSSSMITIHTYINGEFLNSYWSDGLIISTPTGSTGYNLSCGGPILYPASQSFVITPIAPHNLNVRPMIISDQNVISFEVEGRGSTFLATLDSRSESISNRTQLAIKKADFCLSLVRLNGENYLQTLREKLLWGYDNRNFRN